MLLTFKLVCKIKTVLLCLVLQFEKTMKTFHLYAERKEMRGNQEILVSCVWNQNHLQLNMMVSAQRSHVDGVNPSRWKPRRRYVTEEPRTTCWVCTSTAALRLILMHWFLFRCVIMFNFMSKKTRWSQPRAGTEINEKLDTIETKNNYRRV